MTDAHLVDAVVQLQRLGEAARAQMQAADLVERETARQVVRQATPLRQTLEGWIVRRACVAAAQRD